VTAGTIHEDGNNQSKTDYTIHSDWTPASGSMPAAWVDTGTNTGTTVDAGHWTSSSAEREKGTFLFKKIGMSPFPPLNS